MSQDWQIYSIGAVIVVTAIAVVVGAWITFRKKGGKKALVKAKPEKQQLRPEKWALVGKVAKLIVYPIKSCQGVIVEEAVITTAGLKFRDHNIRDRDFMIVDKVGRSHTMVAHPGMAFIKLDLCPDKKDHLIISAPGMEPVTFTYPDASKLEERFCRVKHDTKVRALDCGDEVAEWLQSFIGQDDLRLYYHHVQATQRTFEPYMYDCPQFEQSDMGLFHNETSYLLVAQESIDDLNTRLEKESDWRNWRPTILVDNVSEAFAEVNWSFVKIGNENGILKAAVPCYRCPLTTVDNDTGVLPKDGEPLKTLRKMNKADVFADRKLAELLNNKGIMGLRLGLYLPAGEGAIIKVGDPIYAALL